MQVKIITGTHNPVDTMWIAARTCYSAEGPIEMFESKKLKVQCSNWALVESVLKSGHTSIAEHVNLTFAIEGISRACSHQLVRHRHCTFSQQSQRYVEIKETLTDIQDYLYEINNNTVVSEDTIRSFKQVLSKYFVGVDDDTYYNYGLALKCYLQVIQEGWKPEDARSFLPNAAKTNLVMTCNLRELMHICDLRLCNRAQDEIRQLVRLIKAEVQNNYDERIASLLMPQCDRLGFCPEGKRCCGKKKTLDSLLGGTCK